MLDETDSIEEVVYRELLAAPENRAGIVRRVRRVAARTGTHEFDRLYVVSTRRGE